MKILGKELTFNGNKVYHAGNKPTASEIGAAASSHTHNYAGSSSAGGNANAAVKLATARTINGTSFDGSANITTANWGTARNIQIGNTAKSVNGSANVTWSLSEIGAAAASHGRHIPDTCETITDWNNATKNGWYMGNNAANGPTTVASGGTIWYFGEVITHNTNYVIQVVYQFTASTDAKSIPKYIRAKMNGTWGAWTNVTVSKAVPSNAVFTDTNTWRGVQDNLTSTATDQSLSANQGKVLKGLIDGKAASSHTHNYAGSSSAGGAANSATKLATARSINGTNFDGTGNITTANWGTARNLNGVSVNGSTNYTIPVENYYCNVGDNNTNLYHRILTTDIATTSWVDKSLIIVMHSGYNGGGFGIAKITFRTNDISSEANSQGEIKWLVRNGFAANALVFNFVNQAKNACMDVFYKSPGTYAGMTWYVLSEGGRGGAHSKQWTKYNTNASGTNAYTEANMKTLRTYTSTLVSATDAGHVSTANSANTLATARTINGTSFNGSGNITTANWGTARNLQIGNTAKSVNGSANVTWTLSEIGAAAASHTHAYAPTATGSSISIHADSDSSSTSEYLLLKAGHNELKIASSAGGTTVTKGQDKLTFNGNIVYHAGRKPTISEIGAAASNHTHSYLPLSGGTMTGAISSSLNTGTYLDGNKGRALVNSTNTAGGYTALVKSNSTNGYFTQATYQGNHLLQYTAKSTVDAGNNSVTKTVTLLNESGNSSFPGTVTAPTFSGALSGNATTATKLQTARTINGTSFDGSGNITTANWGTARTITIGKTAKSVNGSANVSWTAAEIGVASIDDSTTATGTVWSSNKTQVQINTSYNTMTKRVEALEESINRDFVSKNGSTMTGDLTIKKSNGAASKLNVHRTINSNDMQGTIDIYNYGGGAVALSTNNKTSGKQTSSYVFGGDAFWSPRNADSVIPDIGTSSYRFKKAWLTDIDVTGVSNLKGTIYGKNNIALDRGSLWLQGAGGNLTCDFLRFGTSIMASSDSKMIYFIDTAGNRATVDCGDLRAVNLKLTNAGYPAIKFSDNVRIEYDVNGDALYAAGTKSTSSGLREFRATQCNSTVNAIIAGKRLFIQSGTPSGVATGDVWIQI